jgi:hypothetical protein
MGHPVSLTVTLPNYQFYRKNTLLPVQELANELMCRKLGSDQAEQGKKKDACDVPLSWKLSSTRRGLRMMARGGRDRVLLKMRDCDDASRTDEKASIREQYHAVGPTQCGCWCSRSHEKAAMTPAASSPP